MKLYFKIILFLMITATLFADKNEDEKTINALSDKFFKMKTLICDFEQVYYNASFGNDTKPQIGKLYIQKPGKMKWEYLKPEKKDILSDGKTLWVYRKDQNLSVSQPGFGEMKNQTGMSFLWGNGKLRDQFDVSVSSESGEKNEIVLVLTPKVPSASMDFIYMLIDNKTYDIKKLTLYDKQRNENRFKFSNLKYNSKVEVEFTPPKDAKEFKTPDISGKS
ncbi:MAG: outer membrane lipoprotein carrier protein LolA [Pseudomonadota bacterium]